MKKIAKQLLILSLVCLVFTSALPNFASAEPHNTVKACVYGSDYFVKGDFIYNVTDELSVQAFKQNIPYGSALSVQAVNGLVATGSVVSVGADSKKVVVYSDVSCDGKVTAFDYLMVRRMYLGTYTAESAEVTEASKVGETLLATDYLRIKRYVLNTYNVFAQPQKYRDYNGLKIAYIPIDNRPVNVDRVKYLAASAGYELLMPSEDLFRTALDNMTKNSNGTAYGDRAALKSWLMSVDGECDYFVISLDQMLSGGLVGSRWMTNSDLTFEYGIADYLIELSKNNTVVLFDTVMRLASTVNFDGYTLTEYNALRSYGVKPRATLTGSNLTVSKIISGYEYGTNGNKISTSLSSDVISDYLASRQRKLKLADYILSRGMDTIDYCYIGVDDSSPETTIQTNEINYIQSKLDSGLSGRSVLFAGTDELGLMGVTRITSFIYGRPQVSVSYFGEGADQPADGFDIATLRITFNKHINSLGCNVVTNNDNALQILVLTKSGNLSSTSQNLVAQAKSNIENGIPTMIIDASTDASYLAERLFDGSVEVSKLLGYSSWNTVANAMGIALSQGICRYLYLSQSGEITQSSNTAFLKSMVFGYIKDISYKCYHNTLGDFTATNYTNNPSVILSRFNSGKIITDLKTYSESTHNTVSCTNYRYPWNRTFEMTFDINA